jgi:hypothetical protein
MRMRNIFLILILILLGLSEFISAQVNFTDDLPYTPDDPNDGVDMWEEYKKFLKDLEEIYKVAYDNSDFKLSYDFVHHVQGLYCDKFYHDRDYKIRGYWVRIRDDFGSDVVGKIDLKERKIDLNANVPYVRENRSIYLDFVDLSYHLLIHKNFVDYGDNWLRLFTGRGYYNCEEGAWIKEIWELDGIWEIK